MYNKHYFLISLTISSFKEETNRLCVIFSHYFPRNTLYHRKIQLAKGTDIWGTEAIHAKMVKVTSVLMESLPIKYWKNHSE